MVDNPLGLDNVMKIINVYYQESQHISGHTISMYKKFVIPDALCFSIDITHDKTLI